MKKKRVQYTAYSVSIGLHALLFLFFASVKFIPESYTTEDGVEVEWVDLEEPNDKLEKRQIVEQDDKAINDQTPLQDYKLSKNTQRVLHETKSANQGAFKNASKETPGAPSKVAEEFQKPQEFTPQPKKNLSMSDLMPKMVRGPAPSKPGQKKASTGGESSATDDYLKDVKTGAQTLLNTREFIYYSYYNRIKGKLRQYWEPMIKDKIVGLLKRGRRIASTKDKITRLVITLDNAGELKKVQVRGASGYQELDQAAIEAFRAAAPFPNPPKGIANGKGEIKINWDFVLES